MISDRYPCPCCGHLTYARPVGGTMQLCPVCFWEDALGQEFWNGSNSVNLVTAQQNFVEIGASEKEFIDSVRPPHPAEEPPANWASFERLANEIVECIEISFSNVTLDNGLTIHQREAISDYQSAEKIKGARRLDIESRWQDIPDEKIRKYGTSLTFLDPTSIRYHLPAFMRCAFRVWEQSRYFGVVDSMLYSLADGPRSNGYHSGSFLLLSLSQNQSVSLFLKFVSRVDTIYGPDAERGLKRGWATYLPDSFPYHFY